MKYKILEHKADIKIKIFGKTLEELFKNAALAMAQILKRDPKLRIHPNASKEKMKIKSLGREILLVDFLNEILARSQINKCLYRVSSFKIQDSSIEAELISYPVESFDEDIKAATYHDLKISQKDGRFEVVILFDI
ncbi:hypothetical protein COS59_00075 [Candidatus Wolfebacteria bacterium CG03_land_8_20_14_0_80_36_15]|uniref:Archease domain-containing protein n=1 Tax=Candidatus Wolfebacteria bacterium CG03_land_8_20_14_0_80_36_15 TaxID=1975067 RepID=A0A2M7B8I1_9BACT|nr:MAG: hypothetical protein COS59_00075 [Candidatus Wolfebacteria bacterium CG03_land_8_20_14_0_80_36_15]